MSVSSSEIIFKKRTSASIVINALLIAAPLFFSLVYVGGSSAKIKELQTTGNGKNQSILIHLQNENDSLRNKVIILASEQENKDLHDQIETLRNENKHLSSQDSVLQTQIKNRNDRIQASEEQKDSLQQTIQDFEVQVEQLRDSNQIFRERNLTLQNQILNNKKEIQDMSRKFEIKLKLLNDKNIDLIANNTKIQDSLERCKKLSQGKNGRAIINNKKIR